MPKFWEEKYLIAFLKLKNPSFEIDGVAYTHHNTEIMQIIHDDLEQKCVMMEFISSEIVKSINLKGVTHSLIEKVKYLISTDLYLIFATHNFGDRILLYVDIKNIVNDTSDNEDDLIHSDNNLKPKNEENVKVEPPNNGEVLAVEESYNELKLKLRNNDIFERVRDFLWYSSKPFSYPDILWNDSYLNLRVQIGLDGFIWPENVLKELYVEFCSELGCTREQIEKDFSLRWKTKALDDIVRLKHGYDAARYEKFRDFIGAQIETLENTIMYT